MAALPPLANRLLRPWENGRSGGRGACSRIPALFSTAQGTGNGKGMKGIGVFW